MPYAIAVPIVKFAANISRKPGAAAPSTGVAVPPDTAIIPIHTATVTTPIRTFANVLLLFFAAVFAFSFVSGDGAGCGKGVVLGVGVGVGVFGVATTFFALVLGVTFFGTPDPSSARSPPRS